jgi:hypothetical protein
MTDNVMSDIHDRVLNMVLRPDTDKGEHMGNKDNAVSREDAVASLVTELMSDRVIMFTQMSVRTALAMGKLPPHSTVWFDGGADYVFQVHNPCACIVITGLQLTGVNQDFNVYISFSRDSNVTALFDAMGLENSGDGIPERAKFIDAQGAIDGEHRGFPKMLMTVAEITDPDFAEHLKSRVASFQSDRIRDMLREMFDGSKLGAFAIEREPSGRVTVVDLNPGVDNSDLVQDLKAGRVRFDEPEAAEQYDENGARKDG